MELGIETVSILEYVSPGNSAAFTLNVPRTVSRASEIQVHVISSCLGFYMGACTIIVAFLSDVTAEDPRVPGPLGPQAPGS